MHMHTKSRENCPVNSRDIQNQRFFMLKFLVPTAGAECKSAPCGEVCLATFKISKTTPIDREMHKIFEVKSFTHLRNHIFFLLLPPPPPPLSCPIQCWTHLNSWIMNVNGGSIYLFICCCLTSHRLRWAISRRLTLPRKKNKNFLRQVSTAPKMGHVYRIIKLGDAGNVQPSLNFANPG